MTEATLFIIGAIVFAMTTVTTLTFGYFRVLAEYRTSDPELAEEAPPSLDLRDRVRPGPSRDESSLAAFASAPASVNGTRSGNGAGAARRAVRPPV